jgi:hypothetical protein
MANKEAEELIQRFQEHQTKQLECLRAFYQLIMTPPQVTLEETVQVINSE